MLYLVVLSVQFGVPVGFMMLKLGGMNFLGPGGLLLLSRIFNNSIRLLKFIKKPYFEFVPPSNNKTKKTKMRIQPLLLLAALPLSLASTNANTENDDPCLGAFCIAPEHQKRGDPTSLDDVIKTGPGVVDGFLRNIVGERRIAWFMGGNSDEGVYVELDKEVNATDVKNYHPGAVEGQTEGSIGRENPIVEAKEMQSWNMRNGNRSTENKGLGNLGNLGKRMITEDNPICQVFSWDGRQGGCTFLTGSMATGICRMKADRIGPFVKWKDGDCAEVVVGHRSDDVSGVWGGCEIRRAWMIEGECRTR